MLRQFLMLRLRARERERAFQMRDGRFERVFGPGRHRLFDPMRGPSVELHNAARAEHPAERSAARKAARPDLAAEMFEPVETKADEVAIASLTGRPSFLVAPYHAHTVILVGDAEGGACASARAAERSAALSVFVTLRARSRAAGNRPRARPSGAPLPPGRRDCAAGRTAHAACAMA